MGNTVIKPAPVCWFIENSKVFTIERISSSLNIPCFFLEYFNTEMLWNGTVPRKQPCLQISNNLSVEVDFYLLSWIFFFQSTFHNLYLGSPNSNFNRTTNILSLPPLAWALSELAGLLLKGSGLFVIPPWEQNS